MINAALAMEGGSLRCMFTAGVVDVFMENDIYFSYVSGVSAGALSGANYVSRQIGRTADVNISYVNDKRYVGLDPLIKHHMVFNFDFLLEEIGGKLKPFDYETFNNSKQRFSCVATNVVTGEPEFFEKGICSEILTAIRASASLPLLSKMQDLNGEKYLDGGFTMPIPFEKCMSEGYDKVVVITTREKGFRKLPVSGAMKGAYEAAYHGYPKLVDALVNRPRVYNAQMRELDKLEEEGKVFVIRPQSPITISRVEKDTEKLKALYEDGRRVGKEMLESMNAYLNS